MKEFYVADMTPQGELQTVTKYDYASLEQIPGAIDVISRCSAEIWKTPDELEASLSDSRRTHLRWRSTAPTAGIATVRRSDAALVSVSLLAAGMDPAADATTIDALQKHLVRELRQTEFEPAFDLVHIKQRPLVATMTFATNSEGSEQMIEALADRCFAAAYFRYLGLA
jgi:hypothetical protein